MTNSVETSAPSAFPIPKPAFDPVPRTPDRELDGLLARLAENARQFARTSLREKIRFLREVQGLLHGVAPEWVARACRAKGIELESPLAGEEWLAGPVVTMRNVRLLIHSLEQVAEGGVPQVAAQMIDESPAGALSVRVTPFDAYDKALLGGYTCDTWLQPEVKRNQLADHQAVFYKQSEPEGGVSLVLGAGNVASIPPMDVLYKMFVDGHVCLLKMNPVNEYLGPFLERAFKPLLDKGYLAVVYGGGDVGAYLCQHDLVTDIHITGSDKTHDLIVWGPPGPERDERKRNNQPLLKKPITSELGNVSPVMVVPGPYSDSEIATMAQNVAGMVANNASFNCNAAKLLVLPKGFAQRDQLLGEIGATLDKLPARKAYYPGAAQRYQKLVEGRQVRKFGGGDDATLPWTIISGLDADKDEPHFHIEPFCAIISETQIAGTDPLEFLAQAVEFANDTLWGTLNAMLFLHPSHERDRSVQRAFDDALTKLRYGAIGVNHWPALVYAFGTPPWGGHPSATLDNIQSGLGWVHNTLMFENVEKSVLRGPLQAFPKPPYFPGNRQLHKLGKRMVDFEFSPSWLKVPALALTALRG